MNATKTIHVFERAGLGKAPFRYAGMEDQDIRYGMRVIGTVGGCTVETKPGGTCDYCGTYIVNMFRIVSADNKTFKVGCECVRKTGDAGLTQVVDRDKKNHDKEVKRRKEDARIAWAKAEYRAHWAIFNQKPHPTPFRARDGKTLADYIDWMFQNAGQAGQVQTAMLIENTELPRDVRVQMDDGNSFEARINTTRQGAINYYKIGKEFDLTSNHKDKRTPRVAGLQFLD